MIVTNFFLKISFVCLSVNFLFGSFFVCPLVDLFVYLLAVGCWLLFNEILV